MNDFSTMATKKVSHFSGLSLTFLFVKKTNPPIVLPIPFLTEN